MSRADELRARFDVEIKMAELEDELVRLKEARSTDPAAPDDEELRRVKNELRDARRAYRTARDEALPEATDGDTAPAEEGNGA